MYEVCFDYQQWEREDQKHGLQIFCWQEKKEEVEKWCNEEGTLESGYREEKDGERVVEE